MSKAKPSTDTGPYVGALLRMAFRAVRAEMLAALHEAGFTDFQDAHFAIFSWPVPEGMRPSEIARSRQMSRQAVNYLLAQLEELGYVERRADGGDDRRRVYLTDRGNAAKVAVRSFLAGLEQRWSDEVGPERFAVFLEVLKTLAAKQQR
ncbi:MAG: MarR family transcriptional regulator [Hyphomicrobiales bacterium]